MTLTGVLYWCPCICQGVMHAWRLYKYYVSCIPGKGNISPLLSMQHTSLSSDARCTRSGDVKGSIEGKPAPVTGGATSA